MQGCVKMSSTSTLRPERRHRRHRALDAARGHPGGRLHAVTAHDAPRAAGTLHGRRLPQLPLARLVPLGAPGGYMYGLA